MKKLLQIHLPKHSTSVILALLCILTSAIGFAQNNSPATWTDIYDVRNGNFYTIQQDFKNTWREREDKATRGEAKIEKGKGYKPFKRWEAFMIPRVYPSGDMTLPSSNYSNYMNWLGKYGPAQSQKKTRAGNWTPLGPVGKPAVYQPSEAYRTGTGRINFIRIDPTNTQSIFAGAPDGGLWHSVNGGSTWTTNTDFLTVIGCSDLVIDPNNTQIMYLATGDLEGDRRSIGVLKTIDGGNNWTATSLVFAIQNGYRITRLLMDPANSLNMIVATNGGSFKTTDGWATNTPGVFPVGFPILKDMELKPSDASVVYTAGTKLYKSVDFGSNWTELVTGLPNSNISRIALAVTPANAEYVYALYGKADDQGFLGLYRSTNSGTSFSPRSTSPNILGYNLDGLDVGGQAFYDLSIVVSPVDAEKVTTGAINHYQSTDGGTNWDIISHWYDNTKPVVHADIHDLYYMPGNNTTMFSGGDGGIFKTTDDGITWTDISNNINISQINRLGISQSDATRIMAGMQDNGTNYKVGGTWTNTFGGDGGESFIDRTNNNRIFYCYVYSEVHRSDDQGVNDIQITTGLPNGTGNEDFYSSFHQDPVVANRLYAGGHPELYRSNNMGGNWTALGTPWGSDNITEFAIAPSNNQIIYAVKIDAVSKSIDGGATFNDVTANLPLSSAFTMVAVSNVDPNKAWVTCSGYTASDKVFQTVDGGLSWTNISNGLPNLPMNTILVMDGAGDSLYVGADIGIYYKDPSIATWTLFTTGLPNVAVRDLEVYYPTRKLRAATYGRGVWESDLFLNVPLPVTLLDFSGAHKTIFNEIKWTTSQEMNLHHFELERSTEGLVFEKIALVEPKKLHSNTETDYRYEDHKAVAGINYYRLKSVDNDEKISYSQVISLQGSNTSGYHIYPNPADEIIYIQLNDEEAQISVWDMNGKMVYTKNKVSGKTQIDTKAFNAGFYIIQIKSAKAANDFSQTVEVKH